MRTVVRGVLCTVSILFVLLAVDGAIRNGPYWPGEVVIAVFLGACLCESDAREAERRSEPPV